MSARRAGRGHKLGATVLIALALACGWPQGAEAGAGKRTIRPRGGAALRPQRKAAVARLRGQRRPGLELAAALRRRALDAEPEVTTALRATLARQGGELVDFDQRIKPSSSLLKKIRRDRRGTELTLVQAGESIADVLRYKVVLSFSDYEATRRAIVAELQGRGFAVVKHKDNWGTRNPGHNLQLRTAAGYTFEIQFQTRASHEANRRTHGLYRQFREARGDQALEIERRIFEITGTVPIPRGAGRDRVSGGE